MVLREQALCPCVSTVSAGLSPTTPVAPDVLRVCDLASTVGAICEGHPGAARPSGPKHAVSPAVVREQTGPHTPRRERSRNAHTALRNAATVTSSNFPVGLGVADRRRLPHSARGRGGRAAVEVVPVKDPLPWRKAGTGPGARRRAAAEPEVRDTEHKARRAVLGAPRSGPAPPRPRTSASPAVAGARECPRRRAAGKPDPCVRLRKCGSGSLLCSRPSGRTDARDRCTGRGPGAGAGSVQGRTAGVRT